MNIELEELKKEIEIIKARNKKVEIDKAWETSYFRRSLVAVLTYSLMTITMTIIKVQSPFTSAIIPTLGFLLSTLTVGAIKNWWVKKKY